MEAPHSTQLSESLPEDLRWDVVDAFREVHARSLHGFALLLTLGDGPEARRLVDVALSKAVDHIEQLRHPERAAAWLRRQVVESARWRVAVRSLPSSEPLIRQGAERAVMRALARLSRLERAALIASDIERLDRRDVAALVGRDGSDVDRLLRRARTRYLRSYVAPSGDRRHGPTIARINAIARRQMR